jgi:NADH:ubiquinone reductase (H+-translocating)
VNQIGFKASYAARLPDAWGAGDNAAIENLSAGTPGVRTVPNAQHAIGKASLQPC